MPETLQTWTPWIIAGVALLAVFIFLAALFFFRRGRRAPYWRLRRAASQRGWQLFLLAVALFLLAGAGCLASGLAQLLIESGVVVQDQPDQPTGAPTEAAALPNTEAPTEELVEPTSAEVGEETPVQPPTNPAVEESPTEVLPSVTAVPPVTPTQPTAEPSSTPQPEPSATPTVTSSPGGEVVESDETFAPDALVEITTVASAVNDSFEPLDAGTDFDEGLTRIYFWLRYDRLTDGAVWSRLLLRDGSVVQEGTYRWAGGEAGETMYFFGDSEGLPVGEYAIQVFLGGELAAETAFSVTATEAG